MSKIIIAEYENTNQFDYGNARDITYNSFAGKLYLTPAHSAASGLDRSVIYKLNVDTYVKEAEYHVTNYTATVIYGIAYDSTNNRYWIALTESGVKKIAILGTGFMITNRYSLPQWDNHNFEDDFRGMEYYDGKVFLAYDTKILVFDSSGNYLKSISIDGSMMTNGIVSKGNGDFYVGKSYIKNYGLTPKTYKNRMEFFNLFSCRRVNDVLATEVKADSSYIYNNFNFIRKKGKVVSCMICFSNISSMIGSVIAEIPEGYRPSHDICVMGAGGGVNYAKFEINTSGEVKIIATSLVTVPSSYWFELEVTYLVG